MRTGLTRRASKCLVEALEDPLLLFSVLYGFLAANLAGFNREVVRELAPEFLALAEKQGNTGLISEAHRLMGHVFFFTGEFAKARPHYDSGITLYDPAKHRPLAARFGQDNRVSALCFRSSTLWLLGNPDAALADMDYAVADARDINQLPLYSLL
jgi:hypothetical protein